MSQSFSWKEIEQKPENADIARLLIESGADRNKLNTAREMVPQPHHILNEFIQKKSATRWFPNFKFDEKKSEKKKNVERIREKVEKQKIDSDLDKFILQDDLSLRTPTFFFPVNNYLYILWWCHVLLQKVEGKRRFKPILLLDATLSIDRLLEKNIITDEVYLSGFKAISKEANSYMNDKFYQLLFENPKMIHSCSFQNTSKEVSLYKEQKIILNTIQTAVEKNEPLLLGNQLPTGQGKTFLSVVLGQLLSTNRNAATKKCVLFACSNELVNLDVASCSLLGSEVHLWMAKLIRDGGESKVLIRPYKSCFPNTWKSVYKRKEDDKMKSGSVVQQWNYYLKETRKIPDIIVCDLQACLKLLEFQHLLNDPFVAYIDEFISDDKSNKLMAEICQVLPRQTVLLSSVLPKFEFIPTVVEHFCAMHETTKEQCCKRVSAVDISIPCCVVDKNGAVRFPHHEVQTRESLLRLIEEMKVNPRIRRTYSPQHVFLWMKQLNHVLPKELSFRKHFPNIGSIQMKKVSDYVLRLLEFLYERFDLLEKFQEYRPVVLEKIKKEDIFQKQCNLYEPKTLVMTDRPAPEVAELTKALFDSEKLPKLSKLLQEMNRKREALENKLDSLKRVKSTSSKVDASQMEIRTREIMEEIQELQLKIPTEFQLNHVDHYKKYHEGATSYPKSVGFPPSIFIDETYINSFSHEELYQLMAGIGTYDVNCQTEYQRKLVMKLYKYLSFLVSGKEIVYGTNLSGLVNIFIDNDFSQNLSISELYQLMGRVGRVGRSYHAMVINVNEMSVKRLLSLEDNVERENDIERIFYQKQESEKALLKYYNDAISRCSDEGQLHSVVSFYDEMGKKDVKKNLVTYNMVLSAFKKMNALENASNLFEEMEMRGISENVETYQNMISILERNGKNRKASILLSKMKEWK